MCGRTSLFVSQEDLEARFEAHISPDIDYRPRFNIAPGDGLEVITNDAPDVIDRYTWGLVPEWMQDPNDGFINARSETVEEKPAFQDAWRRRPCLVLSSGFYEWRESTAGPKQPYRIYREGDIGFAMAGLWEERHPDGNGDRPTVTVLTTEPNDVVKPIHDRMPVVLPPEDETTWLEASPELRAELCRPYPGGDLTAYPISRAINDPTTDDARVIEPLESEQSDLESFG